RTEPFSPPWQQELEDFSRALRDLQRHHVVISSGPTRHLLHPDVLPPIVGLEADRAIFSAMAARARRFFTSAPRSAAPPRSRPPPAAVPAPQSDARRGCHAPPAREQGFPLHPCSDSSEGSLLPSAAKPRWSTSRRRWRWSTSLSPRVVRWPSLLRASVPPQQGMPRKARAAPAGGRRLALPSPVAPRSLAVALARSSSSAALEASPPRATAARRRVD
ncbi:unnamed protein product, partial [Urochloa humidicola]